MSNNFTTVQFLSDIIGSMTFTEPINKFDDTDPNAVKLFVCDTHHITKCEYITVDGSEYEVIDFKLNEYIVINGLPANLTEYTIKAPFFRHGTPLQVETILSNIRDYKDKLPMIYLVEPYSETRYRDVKSRIDRDFRGVLLFCMAIVDIDLDVEEQYPEYIEPIDNLVRDFTKMVDDSKFVENFDRYETVNRVNLGQWVSKDGRTKKLEDNVEKLFDEYITAIEVKPVFSIKKDYSCKC